MPFRIFTTRIVPEPMATGDKRLRPNFALCENRAGMAQPGKALDCYPGPRRIEADIQCSKELGGSNPPPRALLEALANHYAI